jgi:hypothetical protein
VIKTRIQDVLQEKMKSGRNEFILEGEGDFHDIVELAVLGMKSPDLRFRRVNAISKNDLKGSILLLASENPSVPSFAQNHINLIDEINRDGKN